MAENQFNLNSLLPDFGQTLELSSASGLTASVVVFLLAAFFLGLMYSVWKFSAAKGRVSALLSILSDITRDNLTENQRELRHRAETQTGLGDLWREFDESLVLIERSNRLYNTIDAPHFFNTHTLARGLTENRLLAAMPGILTAIGVIGTFAGLQMGLAGLIPGSDASLGSEQSVDDLKSGIFGMIQGASLAFTTSLWGVLLSVSFNFIEKLFERWIRSSITALQNRIDYLYPRVTAEQSLVNIEGSSKVSEEKLAELDEKIGHRLQEAMSQATDSIREGISSSLSEVLAPAIKQLVDGANSSSEHAFESLINEFMIKMGNAGEQQQQALHNTTQSMQTASSQINTGVAALIEKLEAVLISNHDTAESFQSVAKANATAATELKTSAERLGNSSDALERHTAGFSQASSSLEIAVSSSANLIADSAAMLEGINATQTASIDRLESIYGAVTSLQQRLDNVGVQAGDRIEKAQVQLAELIQVVKSQMSTFESSMVSFNTTQEEALTKTTQTMSQASSGVTERVEALLERVNETLSTSSESVESFRHVATANSNAATQLKAVADSMSGSAHALADHKAAIANATTTLNHTTTQAGDQIQQAANTLANITSAQSQSATQIFELTSQVQQVGEQLVAAGSRADEGLTKVNEHFENVAGAMSQHIEQLETQVAKLLSDYAAQVQIQTEDRLNDWNKQTQEYTSAMSNAVNALSSVVDDIETKVAVGGR
jgi:ABC-type transporter Mla subunit MlaD